MNHITIGELVSIAKGKKHTGIGNPQNGCKRYLQIDDLRSDSNLKYTLDTDGVVANPNDILIAWDGANAGTIGFGLSGYIGSTLARLRPVSREMFTPFIGRLLQSCFRDIRANCTGATIPHVSRPYLLNIKISLPNLAEQKRVAAILDQADAIRQKRRQAIEQLNTLIPAIFYDMFGDPVSNPKCWPIGTIRDLVAKVQYGTSKRADTKGEYPILRMNNITLEGEWNFTKLKYIDFDESEKRKYFVSNGDMLFNRTNSKELVGKSAVFHEIKPMAYAGYLIRACANEHGNTDYISGYLNSRHGKATLRNMCKSIIGMANINAQEMQNIHICLPPVNLQNEYANAVAEIRKRRRLHQIAQNETNNLFNSLIQRAFKGQL